MRTTPKQRWERRAAVVFSLIVSGFIATHVMPCMLGMIVSTVFLSVLAAIGLGIVLAAIDPVRADEYRKAMGKMTMYSIASVVRVMGILIALTIQQLELDALPQDVRRLLAALEALPRRAHILPASRRLRDHDDS